MQPNRSQIVVSFNTKVRSLREAMKERNLSALLFYSTGQLSMLEVNPVLWISGVLPMGDHTGVLLTESGEAAMVIGLSWDFGRVRNQTWIEDLRVSERFTEEIQRLIQEKGLGGELGVVGWNFMPAAVYKALDNIPGVKLEVADFILTSAARFPGREALPALERAAQIADIGFSAILEKAKVGMPEHELAAEVEYAMRAQGAGDNFGMVTASDHGHCAHPPSERRMRPGDIIIAEITPAFEGHFVQLCRTTVLGPISPVLREKFTIVEEAMEKSLDRVRPGVRVGEISRVMNEVFSAHGYEKYCKPPYMRVRGHGLGFWSIPFAEIVEENQALIEPGMSFVVHPNQYIPETGYLMLGDTVWVEPEGARRLTQTPMKLFAVGI